MNVRTILWVVHKKKRYFISFSCFRRKKFILCEICIQLNLGFGSPTFHFPFFDIYSGKRKILKFTIVLNEKNMLKNCWEIFLNFYLNSWFLRSQKPKMRFTYSFVKKIYFSKFGFFTFHSIFFHFSGKWKK